MKCLRSKNNFFRCLKINRFWHRRILATLCLFSYEKFLYLVYLCYFDHCLCNCLIMHTTLAIFDMFELVTIKHSAVIERLQKSFSMATIPLRFIGSLPMDLTNEHKKMLWNGKLFYVNYKQYSFITDLQQAIYNTWIIITITIFITITKHLNCQLAK